MRTPRSSRPTSAPWPAADSSATGIRRARSRRSDHRSTSPAIASMVTPIGGSLRATRSRDHDDPTGRPRTLASHVMCVLPWLRRPLPPLILRSPRAHAWTMAWPGIASQPSAGPGCPTDTRSRVNVYVTSIQDVCSCGRTLRSRRSRAESGSRRHKERFGSRTCDMERLDARAGSGEDHRRSH